MLFKHSFLHKIIIGLFVIITWGSCTKDDPETFSITGVSYDYSELNTCAVDTSFGTLFTFELSIDNPTQQTVKNILIDYDYNYFTYGAELVNQFDVSSDKILFSSCFWFDYHEKVTLNFRVLFDNNTQSNLITLSLEKPIVAN